MQKLYIGIDAGASRTRAVIENENRQVLARAESGPGYIGHNAASAWQAIMDSINKSLDTIHLSTASPDIKLQVAIGISGTELKSELQTFHSLPHPFHKLVVESNAYTACLGAHAGASGMIVSVGTGTIGFSQKGDNQYRVGGWGFPFSDEGGGSWLGLKAIHLTTMAQDGRTHPSTLTREVLSLFDNDFSSLINWSMKANSTDFATLAPLVIRLYQSGEPDACTLMQQATGHITHMINTMDYEIGDSTLPICITGGLAPFIRSELPGVIQPRLVKPRLEPARGAIFLIRNNSK